MTHEITVCIPTIPPRSQLLLRAVSSIAAQTLPPVALSIALDNVGVGAGPTRTRAMRAATTEWIAFLDDDDEMMPHHLDTLVRAQKDSGADVIWPWFSVVNGTDPFPAHRGRQLDVNNPHIFPISVLIRREVIGDAFFPAPSGEASWSGDDWPFHNQLIANGATFFHTPEITWLWNHASNNTSGLPWKRNRKAPW